MRLVILDEDHANLLKLLFEMEGHTILCCPLGVDLATLIEYQPDVVVLDEGREGHKRGWPLVRRVRAEGSLRQVPVMLCTAAHLTAAHYRDFHALDIMILAKPFDLEELLRTVQQMTTQTHGNVQG